MAKLLTVKMVLSKETKGTYVYMSDEDTIPTLYIRKSALESKPESITVTVEA